ncbi:MAG: hypothetical protein ACYC4L_13305 [Chloroflexota bacterium]
MAMATPRQTGASNIEYNLISLLYHTLQGNENLTKYEQDAKEAGDNEAAQLFRELRESNKQILDRGRQLLGTRMGKR